MSTPELHLGQAMALDGLLIFIRKIPRMSNLIGSGLQKAGRITNQNTEFAIKTEYTAGFVHVRYRFAIMKVRSLSGMEHVLTSTTASCWNNRFARLLDAWKRWWMTGQRPYVNFPA